MSVGIHGLKTTLIDGSLRMLRVAARPTRRPLKLKISIGVIIAKTSPIKIAARMITAAFADGPGPRATTKSGGQRMLSVDAEPKLTNSLRMSWLGETTVKT